jgi:hypothetical protein
MNQSEQLNELAAALSKAQGQIEGAKKDSANPFFKSKYADLASVWEACRKPLTDNGLSIIQCPEESENGIAIETMLLHSSGQWKSSRYSMPVSKVDAQAVGSAITYGRRYALAAMVGVAPEDDDGNAAAKGKPEEKVKDLPAPYPETEWVKKATKWRESIESGEKKAQALIDYLLTIGTITQERKDLIKSWEPKEGDIQQ